MSAEHPVVSPVAAGPEDLVRHVVSLGTTCFTAQAISDAGLRRYSLPFDWIFSGSGMIRAILLDDFHLFLDRSSYENCGSSKSWTLPTYRRLFGSGTILNHHDVRSDDDFASLARAVDRFRRLVRSLDRKLFVTIVGMDALDHPHNEELRQTLRALTPNASFLTVGLQPVGDTAKLERLGAEDDYRSFAFTPTSEFLEGLRFANASDNTLLRQVLNSYRFELLDQPGPVAPARPWPAPGKPVLDVRQASDLLQHVRLEQVVSESHHPRPDPDFLYGDHAAQNLPHFRNDQYLPPVDVLHVRDARLVGPHFMTGALVQVNDVQLSIPAIASDPATAASTARLADVQARIASGEMTVRKVAGAALLLACNGHQIYGHWLVDFLPKLAILHHVGLRIDAMPILLPVNMAGFGRSLLRLAGIRDEQIIEHDPEREVLEVENLVVPSTLRWGGRCVPSFGDAIGFLNERIDRSCALPDRSYPTRLFLSRSLGAMHGRQLAGEAELVVMAERYGFTAVAPEMLPLAEQVAMLRGASHIIGPYGSGLHGSIFNRRQVAVCGFHGPTSFDALQSGIGERLGQPTGYVFSQPTVDTSGETATAVRREDFQRFLAERMG